MLKFGAPLQNFILPLWHFFKNEKKALDNTPSLQQYLNYNAKSGSKGRFVTIPFDS